MKHLWDERYSSESYIYGKQPNVFFQQGLSFLSPGKLLLPGEGEGRNAVWASLQGWQAYAVDYSLEAKRKALSLADKHAVKLHSYIHSDLENFEPEEAYYDAAALIYLHLDADFRSRFHQRIVKALKPGGHLILEAFSTEQIQFQSGGPRNISMLYKLEELAEDFRDLHFLQLENFRDQLSEGTHHIGKAAIIRILAQKPL